MTDARGFKVPKILRRQESKDNLRAVDLKSRDAQEISDIVSRSFLERNYKSPWEIQTLHLVENKELEDSYRAKKTEMKDEGRHARDLVDQYAFLLFRDSSVMAKVIKQGLVARQMPFNALGASKYGVYLCRNADVQLRLADGKGLSNCTLVVFKIMLGKCKTLTQQSATEGENIEPTPNYDCHVSQVQARPTDSLYLQLARSQVFLYEYTDEYVPSERPRQCLPYAILSYEKNEKKESVEIPTAYAKQTITTPTTTATVGPTASEIMATLKKSISFTDSVEKMENAVMGRSSSDPNFSAHPQTEAPLQAIVVQTEPRPKDPRQGRMGDSRGTSSDLRGRPVESRLSKVGMRDPRIKLTDTRGRQSEPKTSIPLPNFSDPRFQPLDQGSSEQTQSKITASPSDPRQAAQDSRLNPSDPRLNPYARRIRDPRIRANPTLKSLAKNIQSVMSIFGELGSEEDDSAYRPSFGPPLGMPSQHDLQSMQNNQDNLSSLPDINLPRDPRLRKAFLDQVHPEMAAGQGSSFKTSSDNSAVDQGGGKFPRKKLSINEYKKKVEVLIKHDESKNRQNESAPASVGHAYLSQPIVPSFYGSAPAHLPMPPSGGFSEVFDMSNNALDETIDDMNRPYSPDYDEIPDPTVVQSEANDVITSPQKMMQTLSELSEPEDESQSPEQLPETDSEEVESALTIAIRKLVEHSPDMSILTQAIQVLGQTHDMKDILEALKKAMENEIKPEDEEIPEKVNIPEKVMRTEQVMTDDSPLSMAVKRTLEEVEIENKQEIKSKTNSEVDTKNETVIRMDTDLSEMPSSKPEVQTAATKSESDNTHKENDPKIQEFVKFFLDKEEEEEEDLVSNKPSFGVKRSPGMGISPGKSLLLGSVDKDERQHATKQLFQGGMKEIADEKNGELHQVPSAGLYPVLSDAKSSVAQDVDERQHHSRSQSPNMPQDVDERRSHSRSLSPARKEVPKYSAMKSFDERSSSPFTPFSAIPGLGDVDERSHSPIVSKPLMSLKAVERKFPTPIMSPDPETSDSLKDVFTNKNIIISLDREREDSLDVDLRQAKENEFGDVDWRWKAAAEMGDVDLRANPGQAQAKDFTLPPVFEAVDDFWTKRENKEGDVEFRKSLGMTKLDNQKQQNKPYESYSTSSRTVESCESINKNIPSYSTAGGVYGEYSSSKKMDMGDIDIPAGHNLPPFPPGFFPPNPNFVPPQQPIPQQPPNMMNFGSILGSVNLDFANLKNILATVQKPQEIVVPKNNFPEEVEEEDEVVTSNLPAFVTGLCKESPKKDLSLSKYTGKPREWIPGKRPFVHKEEQKPEVKDPNYDPTRAPELQRPVKENQRIDKVEKSPEKFDRNFEPVQLDRKSAPFKSDKNLEPFRTDRNVDLDKSDRNESMKSTRHIELSESKSQNDVDKKPKKTESRGSEIRKLVMEDRAISKKSFKDSSDRASIKGSQTPELKDKSLLFSVGDLVGQVRESSVDKNKDTDSKTSERKATSDKINKKAEDMGVKGKDNADKRNDKAKTTDSKSSKDRADKSKKIRDSSDSSDSDDHANTIFSIGDMLKRMRGPAPKRTSDKDKSKQKKKSSPTKSPKKRRSNEQEEQTSYQEAIMESLETSDLKIKHDDSVLAEIDQESPKRRKHTDIISKDMYSDMNLSAYAKTAEANKSYRTLEKPRLTNSNETGIDDVSDNSDEESFGLVIDLGETPAKKTADKVPSEETLKSKTVETSKRIIETEEPEEEADCLVVEMEAERAEVVDLTENDDDHEMVTADGTHISRKIRRQQQSDEDSESIPLVKKIKIEKLDDDEERERRIGEEAKVLDTTGTETDDMAVVAGQGDSGNKLLGLQPRKKIKINLKFAAKKTDKKETEEKSKKDSKEDSNIDSTNASQSQVSKGDKKDLNKTKTDLGPIRPLERLGQRNLSEPRAPSPIAVLGAPPRAPSPTHSSQKSISAHTASSSLSTPNTVATSAQSWSTNQQNSIRPVKPEQSEGYAIPNLSQISSIPPPSMSNIIPHGFSTVSATHTVSTGIFVPRTIQNLPGVIPSMTPGISVPMPPVAQIGPPPAFHHLVSPNLSVPPPSLPLFNIPPPILANQPPTQTLGQYGSAFPQRMPRIVTPNLQTPPPNLRPTVQGNLTIPVIGQPPTQSSKQALMQDVLQRVHQRVPASLSHTLSSPTPGMPIQTIGQSATGIRPSYANKNLTTVETRAPETKKEKSDVLDWFSDKFDIKKEPRDHSTPIRAREELESRQSNTPEYHDSERKRLWEYHEHDDYVKKLKLTPSGDNHGDHYYKSKQDYERDTEQSNLPSGGEIMVGHDNDYSDLEEGECSEDSSVAGSPLITEHDNRRVVVQSRIGNNIQVACGTNSIQRIQTIQTIGDTSSPKRIVNVSDNQRHRNVAADDWADMLKGSHDHDPREKLTSAFSRLDSNDSRTVNMQKETHIVKGESSDSQDSAGILASSAAAITKTKNKITRGFQVKTLGDWLKVELEIENIQPLQKYIPYAFSTDLTAIPKGRRRKIKTKVRTVLEKEGKATGVHQEVTSQAESSEDTTELAPSHTDTKESEGKLPVLELNPNPPKPEQPKPGPPQPGHKRPPINPTYSPEVPNTQIQIELELVKKVKADLKNSAMVHSSNPSHHFGSGMSVTVKNELFAGNIIPGSEAEIQLIAALLTVETEMVTMLQRTYFYGYPHRRVPKDLLLESEMYSFKSPDEDVFLILMMPLSIKPYNKLKQMKTDIENLLKQSSPDKAVEEELKTLHNQREQVLKSFTGYLNKKRITKLQDLVNKYTLVYDFFKGQPRCPSDSVLRFIRTTQIDLRQHLILAKQYLAMEEKKLEAEINKG